MTPSGIPPYPRWPGVVVCMASGPSLTADDVETVRATGVPAVVTNTTYRLAPWADALFAFDVSWWRVHIAEVRATFAGRKYCQNSRWPYRGVEFPGTSKRYRPFGNSGACAIALAVGARATRIVLLGYDCQLTGGRTHHHGDHPSPLRNCDAMHRWPEQFARAGAWATRHGVEVLNASRETALTCFPRASLADALTLKAAA